MGDGVHGGHRHQRTGTVGHGEGGQRDWGYRVRGQDEEQTQRRLG